MKAPINSEKLAFRIYGAFHIETPPTCPDCWLQDSEYTEDTELFWGKCWKELDVDLFHSSMYAFFKFPPQVLPYFLGAMMYASIQESQYFNDSLGLILEDSEGNLSQLRKSSFLLRVLLLALTREQQILFLEFLLLASEKVERDWTNLFVNSARLVSEVLYH